VLDPVQSYPHPYPPAFPPEVMSAPRLHLPDREYLLFEAGLDDLGQMVIRSGLSCGGHEPALFWPEDRAWFVATEFDLVVTLVGGTHALVGDLVADQRLSVAQSCVGQQPEALWTD